MNVQNIDGKRKRVKKIVKIEKVTFEFHFRALTVKSATIKGKNKQNEKENRFSMTAVSCS